MKFCPCCKKLRFCFELEVMPSKIAELNDLANQCQQDIDMESTHLEPLKVKADKLSEAVNKAYYNGGYLDEDEDMTGRYWEYQKYRDKQSVVLTELNSLMGGNALINMNYAVSKNQFLDIRMLTATAIKIKPSASFKLSDKILDSITALERLWDEA